MNHLKLDEDDHSVVEGAMVAVYEWTVYRFLLSDGRTLDVRAIQDDSNLRRAVLDHTKAERIEGVATLPPLHGEPEPPKKRTRTRK